MKLKTEWAIFFYFEFGKIICIIVLSHAHSEKTPPLFIMKQYRQLESNTITKNTMDPVDVSFPPVKKLHPFHYKIQREKNKYNEWIDFLILNPELTLWIYIKVIRTAVLDHASYHMKGQKFVTKKN